MSSGSGLARSRRGGHRRRKSRATVVREAGVGAAAVAVAALAVGGVFFRTGDGTAASGEAVPPGSTAAASAAPARQAAVGGQATTASAGVRKSRDAKTAGGPSKHTDTEAVGYFKKRWVADKSVKRITDIRTVGKYLRIYTDLPQSGRNSKPALDLCKRGLEYLVQERGDEAPVVFVQAKYGMNGNPVLANIMGPGDTTCRLTYPDPR
ncbi:hypothetical protein [Sphaerisporangium sp. TRM90804]|uniref:hypothetical protein n=1 Tax=Sphaerisporangium sp. TRM90804 TaxID=3031113 RepID=UPI00244C1002|nr:hypothetical protein [Sphaerisporangium sp. TRM90804]MDH2424249.1 hypothetical protein [Sphaerisporangium sp. TRM90804]